MKFVSSSHWIAKAMNKFWMVFLFRYHFFLLFFVCCGCWWRLKMRKLRFVCLVCGVRVEETSVLWLSPRLINAELADNVTLSKESKIEVMKSPDSPSMQVGRRRVARRIGRSKDGWKMETDKKSFISTLIVWRHSQLSVLWSLSLSLISPLSTAVSSSWHCQWTI